MGAEDRRLVEWSYQAMQSSVFPRNRLSAIERGVAGFHDAIRREIPVAGLETPLPPAAMARVNRCLLEGRI